MRRSAAEQKQSTIFEKTVSCFCTKGKTVDCFSKTIDYFYLTLQVSLYKLSAMHFLA